ncbi:hypothetical protein HDU92_000899, partial [Lobulomyces angularis]
EQFDKIQKIVQVANRLAIHTIHFMKYFLLNYEGHDKWDVITEKNFVRIYKLLNKPVKTTKSSKPETKGLNARFSDYIERYKEITKYNGEAVQNFDQIATYQGEIIFTNFW